MGACSIHLRAISHRKHSRYLSLIWIWKLLISDYSPISQHQWVNLCGLETYFRGGSDGWTSQLYGYIDVRDICRSEIDGARVPYTASSFGVLSWSQFSFIVTMQARVITCRCSKYINVAYNYASTYLVCIYATRTKSIPRYGHSQLH